MAPISSVLLMPPVFWTPFNDPSAFDSIHLTCTSHHSTEPSQGREPDLVVRRWNSVIEFRQEILQLQENGSGAQGHNLTTVCLVEF
mmetsp:Transcript_25961/g.85472  ORF Transcript_25961/g.85472 Transcript_25961/m.85472 type:complete len:86 (-) Transcript_25961:529-786(-)